MITTQKSSVSPLILPIDEWAWMIMEEIAFNMRKEDFEMFTLPTSFYKNLLLESIRDAIDEKSIWINHSIKDIHLVRYLDGFDWFSFSDKFSCYLYEFIDEFAVFKVNEVIDEIIPNNTYNIWDIKEIGRSNIYILEKGEDYRIEEFYRLKEMYEPDTEIHNYDTDINTEYLFEYLANDKDKTGEIINKTNLIMNTQSLTPS